MNNENKHILSATELNHIYRCIDDLRGDLTREEYEAHKQAFMEILTIAHSLIQEEYNKLHNKE